MCLLNLPICCSSLGLARGDHHGHASTRLAELTAEKIEAKQREFWRLFERFVEIKRRAMTKRAAILFELPGSCDYWKDERLHEVVHDGISHEFDG